MYKNKMKIPEKDTSKKQTKIIDNNTQLLHFLLSEDLESKCLILNRNY